MTGEYSATQVSINGGVAQVVIDHPPLNLLDATLIFALDRFAASMSGNDDVRVIVFDSADPDFFIAHGDMTFADDAEHAGLAQPETAGAIIPGAGGTAYLTGLVGRARALEIILGTRLIDAATAERYG